MTSQLYWLVIEYLNNPKSPCKSGYVLKYYKGKPVFVNKIEWDEQNIYIILYLYVITTKIWQI